jgi:hypothetical protein
MRIFALTRGRPKDVTAANAHDLAMELRET